MQSYEVADVFDWFQIFKNNTRTLKIAYLDKFISLFFHLHNSICHDSYDMKCERNYFLDFTISLSVKDNPRSSMKYFGVQK